MASSVDDPCLDEEVLAGFVHGALMTDEAARAERHIARCAPCRRIVSALGAAASVVGGRAGGSDVETAIGVRARARVVRRERSAMTAGSTFGRYRIVERLGSGGLGEVWAARDPQLGRKVAIKVLRRDVTDESTAWQARIEREAQAMAKLSHPNVVTVFDAGREGDLFYIAMELVDGTTFRDWQAAAPRPLRAIVKHFVAAGRGLAAIHRAGLVHRDIKPENLMIGPDEQVLVMDLGLARFEGAAAIGHAPDAPSPAMTDPGVVIGTPAYMAPEQHRGEPTDHRSDQFSFCVTLFEAVYGVRPFAGTTREALHDAIERGEIREPPDKRVPAPLRSVIRRGLAAAPADRYPSMDELLAELGRAMEPGSSLSRRWFAVLGIGLVAVAVALALWSTRDRGTTDTDRASQREVTVDLVADAAVDGDARVVGVGSDQNVSDAALADAVHPVVTIAPSRRRDAGIAATDRAPDAAARVEPRFCRCGSPREAPDRQPLCPKLGSRRCSCVQSGGWELCTVPVTGADCADRPNAWSGVTGESCTGYLTATERVEGTLRCMLCDPGYDYEGAPGERCSGLHPIDGQRYEGTLAGCTPRRK